MFFELVSQVSGVTHWPLVVSLFIFKDQIYICKDCKCVYLHRLGHGVWHDFGGWGGGGGGAEMF